MIQLAFSHRSETLLATMAADIARYRGEQGPWAPLHLVVPNPCVKQAVLEGLAKGLRVVTHQTTYYLEGFWRRNLPITDPPIQLLDRAMLQGLLLSLLQDRALLEEPDLLPLQHYLAGDPRDLKALQLATEVAGVFEAYLLGRPDWAPAWERNPGKPAAENAPPALEAWQRRLWCELRARLKAAPGQRRVLTFPEYLKDPAFDLAPFPEDVFIYGLGPMARAQHETMACDLFMVLGSSLVVYPAAGFPRTAKKKGAQLVILNREPTDQDDDADLAGLTRNALCPCGSGKKFKHCHGELT